MKKDYIQVLRGIAILGVLMIHVTSNSESNLTLVIRQLVNYAVPLFLFIAGYLINTEKFNNKDYIKSFYKKRVLRVGIPYLIFSIIAFLLSEDLRKLSLAKKIFFLLTGQANSIYYYILVYIQLILLTPILIKLLNKIDAKFIYSITILSRIIEYILILTGHQLRFPYNSLFFPTWILFYYMGLVFKNTNKSLNIKKISTLTIIMFILSICEGVIWLKLGYTSVAVSTAKISSLFFGFYFIEFLIYFKDSLNNKLLKFIGDNSFGIYLIHMFILRVINSHISFNIELINITFYLVSTLVISLLIIFIVKKVIGDKYALKLFGF